MKNFWTKLEKPFFVLAPMANVTDSAFRKIIAKYGKPDVTWTEFVSADGLVSAGQSKLLPDLAFSNAERPIVAQLFSGHPDAMEKASRLVQGLGFDGIDINMGCPDKSVEKQGGGAALIKDKKNALAVLESARRGADEIPVSVKTRIGYNKESIDDWISFLLEQKLPVLTVHLRTRKEMSDCGAHWELMPRIVALRDKISPETLIIGNGDISSPVHGREMLNKYGGDGVMIGRGIFGKPWTFEKAGKIRKNDKNHNKNKKPDLEDERTPKERLSAMLEHTKLFEKMLTGHKSFDTMKKHFKAYVSGWDGAKELRVELMGTSNYKEVKAIVGRYLRDTDL